MAREKVKIVNRHDREYSELLNTGETIVIPAGGYITMGRSEAVKFLGKHPGMDSRTGKAIIKKLFIEPLTEKEEVKPEVTPKAQLEPGMVACPFGCGFVAKNKTSLSVHLRTCKS
jgi:hypothetical protein